MPIQRMTTGVFFSPELVEGPAAVDEGPASACSGTSEVSILLCSLPWSTSMWWYQQPQLKMSAARGETGQYTSVRT